MCGSYTPRPGEYTLLGDTNTICTDKTCTTDPSEHKIVDVTSVALIGMSPTSTLHSPFLALRVSFRIVADFVRLRHYLHIFIPISGAIRTNQVPLR